MIRCWLVDDDAEIRALLPGYLQGFGFAVTAVHDGPALRQSLASRPAPEVLLLDLMLPGEDGLSLCQWIKRERPEVPVLMLTAQGDPMSRVLGLELGADDYLPKPFEPRELVARIKAVMRRGQGAAPGGTPAATVRFDGWSFDRMRRELVARDGTVLALSAAEFRLLSAFVEHAGRALARDRLIDLTRTRDADVGGRSVDLAVSRLRAKLGSASDGQPLIRTVRGEGYVFDAKVRS